MGGGNFDVDAGDPLVLLLVLLPLLLLKPRKGNGDRPKELTTIVGVSLGTDRKTRTDESGRLQYTLGACKTARDTRLIARVQHSVSTCAAKLRSLRTKFGNTPL